MMPVSRRLLLPLLALACDRAPPAEPVDADGDGARAEWDCDDTDPEINPWADEVCDGVDNDCDGEIDEDLLKTYYVDTDGDNYGDAGTMVQACSEPDGATDKQAATDCDDADPHINKTAMEVCDDGVDNDCDGETDERDDCMTTVVRGHVPNLHLGVTAGPPVDLDQDGRDDLFVTAYPRQCTERLWGFYWSEVPVGEVSSDSADAVLAWDFVYTSMDWYGGFQDPVAVLPPQEDDGYPSLALLMTAELPDEETNAIAVISGPLSGDLDMAVDAYAHIDCGGSETDACSAVALAGDTDADGYDDLLVGTFGQDDLATNAGAASLVLGPMSGSSTLEDAAATFWGSDKGDNLGFRVLGLGDIDADGMDDVALSVPGYDQYGGFGAPSYAEGGRVGLFRGPLTGELTIDDADAVYSLAEGIGLGVEIAAGDMDSDGYTDLLAAAIVVDGDGVVFLLPGPLREGGEVADLALAQIQADDSNSRAVATVDVLGDTSGDGIPDLVTSDLSNDATGPRVFYGPFSGVLDASEYDRLVSTRGSADFSSAGAGDLDGDGLDDIAILSARYHEAGEDGEHVELGRVGILGPVSGVDAW